MKTKCIKQVTELSDLVSVGPATVKDLHLLGITEISQLIGKDAWHLFQMLCRITGKRHDPCVIDVFAAAIAQAENPSLPTRQKQWWYWSRIRKNKGRI